MRSSQARDKQVSAWRNDLNECIDHIMEELARASQGVIVRRPWTSEENTSPGGSGHYLLRQRCATTHRRKPVLTWHQRGKDAQHRTTAGTFRRKFARAGKQNLAAISQSGVRVLERQNRAIGAGQYAV